MSLKVPPSATHTRPVDIFGLTMVLSQLATTEFLSACNLAASTLVRTITPNHERRHHRDALKVPSAVRARFHKNLYRYPRINKRNRALQIGAARHPRPPPASNPSSKSAAAARVFFVGHAVRVRGDFHPPACVIAAKSMSSSAILRGAHPCRTPTHPINEARRHPDPLRHPFEYWRNTSGIQRSTDLCLTHQPPKYRPLVDLRMLKPHLQPPHRRAREICHSPLPFRILFTAPDQGLAGTVRMEINVSDLERHKFAATGEGFVGNTEHGPLTIRAQPFAGGLDKFLVSFQLKGCAWSWRAEVSRPIFFNPNRTASLADITGFCNLQERRRRNLPIEDVCHQVAEDWKHRSPECPRQGGSSKRAATPRTKLSQTIRILVDRQLNSRTDFAAMRMTYLRQ